MSDFDRIESRARDIGEIIGSMLPPDIGFALMLFKFGNKGEMTFVSNGVREDMVKALRELLVLLEHDALAPPSTPGHPARAEGEPS